MENMIIYSEKKSRRIMSALLKVIVIVYEF